MVEKGFADLRFWPDGAAHNINKYDQIPFATDRKILPKPISDEAKY